MRRPVVVAAKNRPRVAGVFYLINYTTSSLPLAGTYFVISNLIANGCYVVVVVLFYQMFKPVSGRVSVLAAMLGLVDCTQWALSIFHLLPFQLDGLVFLGLYLIPIGYLIYKSALLPQLLGALVTAEGLDLLTFASSSLSSQIFLFNAILGLVGEGALTLWLLVKGATSQSWQKKSTNESTQSKSGA